MGPSRTGPNWVRAVIRSGDYTFRDMFDEPELMAHYVKMMMREGDERGYPVLRPQEKVPSSDDIYQCSPHRRFRRSSTRPHPEMPFFRLSSVNGAVLYCKNHGWYLNNVRAKDMPTGNPWNNFPQCLHRFAAVYCLLEGILRTSVMARKVVLYTFYGTFEWATKDSKKDRVLRTKPVMFCIQKKVMNGRSRFVNKVDRAFAGFIQLYKANKWEQFLLDKGTGTVPVEYLIAIESGLRKCAENIHAMGTHALRSRFYWGNVEVWRKREAYVCLVRFLLNSKVDYNQWDCFLWSDYVQRQRACKTFMSRHLPLSDGNDDEHFGGRFEFDWDAHKYSPKKKTRATKRPRQQAKQEARSKSASPQTSNQIMIYDVDNDCLVPMDMD